MTSARVYTDKRWQPAEARRLTVEEYRAQAGKPRRRRKSPEGTLHAQVALFLRHALIPPAWFSTIGHGGGGKVRGAQLKRAGMRAGMPDLIVFGANGYVLGIELKAGKGRQSPEQTAVADDMRACGQDYAVCRSIEDVAAALLLHGIPTRARAA